MKALACLVLLVGAGCASPAGELLSLAELPPLDYAVLITGGAFVDDPPLPASGPLQHTFAPGPDGEAFPLARVVEALRQGAVFRRIGVDTDTAHRRAVLQGLPGEFGTADGDTKRFLQQARDDGYDLMLTVEWLKDGPVEVQGINGRWPLTLTTWFLLGVGMLIPDHTFESRATLRVTLRDLQTGRFVHEQNSVAGPVDLSLLERSNFLGFLTQIVVPPFWVQDDAGNVVEAVRGVTERRLQLSVARDLKSEPVRQRLRQKSYAAFDLQRRRGGGLQLRIEARESLAVLRLRQGDQAITGPAFEALQAALLASVQQQGDRLVYTAELQLPLAEEPLQVMVATIVGNVASATLDVQGSR